METILVGDVAITRVEEWHGTFVPPSQLLVGWDAAAWRANEEWLAPDHFDPASGTIRACLQPYVVRAGGMTILYDTGAGNDKVRPNLPIFGNLKTEFLARLQAAGVAPEDVDLVICSHLHIDHVGWNTRLDDGRWVPTFPKAKYLLPAADIEYWDPENDSRYPARVGTAVNHGVFDDSVRPVLDENLAVVFEGPQVVNEYLRLEPAPGHTPGQVVMQVESKGERALFCGDVLHSPMQILYPDWNSCFCEQPVNARASRRRVLEWCVTNHALLIPAHYGGAHAAWVKRAGDAYAIDSWA